MSTLELTQPSTQRYKTHPLHLIRRDSVSWHALQEPVALQNTYHSKVVTECESQKALRCKLTHTSYQTLERTQTQLMQVSKVNKPTSQATTSQELSPRYSHRQEQISTMNEYTTCREQHKTHYVHLGFYLIQSFSRRIKSNA